jgi:hypothetical protein
VVAAAMIDRIVHRTRANIPKGSSKRLKAAGFDLLDSGPQKAR